MMFSIIFSIILVTLNAGFVWSAKLLKKLYRWLLTVTPVNTLVAVGMLAIAVSFGQYYQILQMHGGMASSGLTSGLSSRITGITRFSAMNDVSYLFSQLNVKTQPHLVQNAISEFRISADYTSCKSTLQFQYHYENQYRPYHQFNESDWWQDEAYEEAQTMSMYEEIEEDWDLFDGRSAPYTTTASTVAGAASHICIERVVRKAYKLRRAYYLSKNYESLQIWRSLVREGIPRYAHRYCPQRRKYAVMADKRLDWTRKFLFKKFCRSVDKHLKCPSNPKKAQLKAWLADSTSLPKTIKFKH